jgi:8-oxo-dGTP pyrophosphatase MutT (NUDIX family)
MLTCPSITSKRDFVQRFSIQCCHQYDKAATKRAWLAAKNKTTLKPAAVMVALVERQNDLFVLLTRRSAHLKHHPSQICFPGGRAEQSDKDKIATAFREMEEEIGVKANRQDVLGQLLPLHTVSGYHVTPVVGFVDSDYEPQLNKDEVADLFELPLSFLLRPDAIKSQHFSVKGENILAYATHYQQHFIWGMTAHILYSLNQHIRCI